MNIPDLSLLELSMAETLCTEKFREAADEEEGLFWHSRLRACHLEMESRLRAIVVPPDAEVSA